MVEEFLRLDLKYATNIEIGACAELNRLINDKSINSVMRRLETPTQCLVAPHEMENLLRLLARAFFPCGDSIKFSFSWMEQRAAYGSCILIDGVASIKMSPTSWAEVDGTPVLQAAGMGRLSTLLHETVHAFLGCYTCKCPMEKIHVEDWRGHGIAWQRISNWVECSALETLHLPLDLARFGVITAAWDDLKVWPSPEEVSDWELRDG